MRFSIKLKLGLAFGLIITIMIGAIGYGLTSLGQLNEAMTQLVNGPVARLRLAGDVRTEILQIARAEKNIIIETDPEKAKAYDAQLNQQRQNFEALLDEGDELSSPEGKVKYAELRSVWATMAPLDIEVRQLALSGQIKQATALSLGALRAATTQCISIADGLVTLVDRQMKEQEAQNAKTYASSREILIAMTIASLLIAAAAA
jgi:methyl-accepting chemotaxis protein